MKYLLVLLTRTTSCGITSCSFERGGESPVRSITSSAIERGDGFVGIHGTCGGRDVGETRVTDAEAGSVLLLKFSERLAGASANKEGSQHHHYLPRCYYFTLFLQPVFSATPSPQPLNASASTTMYKTSMPNEILLFKLGFRNKHAGVL